MPVGWINRDFELLERNYVSVGGELTAIRGAEKNVGSEALSAWMFHRASQENPLDLLGAMFIIEGLGSQLAARWGGLIKEQLGADGRPSVVPALSWRQRREAPGEARAGAGRRGP